MGSPRRITTVDIEGYGPVTIKALTKKQLVRIFAEANDDQKVQEVLVLRRGVADERLRSMSDSEFIAEFEDRPEVLTEIVEAIVDRSWGGKDAMV